MGLHIFPYEGARKQPQFFAYIVQYAVGAGLCARPSKGHLRFTGGRRGPPLRRLTTIHKRRFHPQK